MYNPVGRVELGEIKSLLMVKLGFQLELTQEHFKE